MLVLLCLLLGWIMQLQVASLRAHDGSPHSSWTESDNKPETGKSFVSPTKMPLWSQTGTKAWSGGQRSMCTRLSSCQA